MFNELTVVGHLTKDPEVSYTTGQDKVVKVSLGSSVWRKDKPYTIWVTVYVWGGAADFAEKHVHKGDLVQIVGSLLPDRETGNPKVYRRHDGSFGSSYEIKCRLLTRLHKKDPNSNPYPQGDIDDDYESIF